VGHKSGRQDSGKPPAYSVVGQTLYLWRFSSCRRYNLHPQREQEDVRDTEMERTQWQSR